MAIPADGSRDGAKNCPACGEGNQTVVVVLIDPMLCDPICPTGETQPDYEEHPEVFFREVVFYDSHRQLLGGYFAIEYLAVLANKNPPHHSLPCQGSRYAGKLRHLQTLLRREYRR